MQKIILTPPLTEFLDPLRLNGCFDNASLFKLATGCAIRWVESGVENGLTISEIVAPFGLSGETLDHVSAAKAIAQIWCETYWETDMAKAGGRLQ